MKSILRIYQDVLSSDVRNICQDVDIKYVPRRLATPKMAVNEQKNGKPSGTLRLSDRTHRYSMWTPLIEI
ncbi:hypothetical protein DPMN_012561 [Dreissena polymorpha]|uniref:Uncharacterized protein n=1 Tax=Dreissena polymorpha TaxID=45954 RepID=A0A9D4S2V3_DREPO|nr:hypothetical protein DPMN_012561 [Dreissena polymorpha]